MVTRLPLRCASLKALFACILACYCSGLPVSLKATRGADHIALLSGKVGNALVVVVHGIRCWPSGGCRVYKALQVPGCPHRSVWVWVNT